MLQRIIAKSLSLAVVANLAVSGVARAQENISFIRDAEIESDIRTFVTPIFKAARLDPDAIHIYLVVDQRLNSFVAGGQNIFINTGTILKAKRPNQLIGVLAHETGHIAGGHLARSEEALRNASIEGIIAMVLGAAAGAFAKGNAAGAGLPAGAQVGERAFLQFSVAQEGTADQAGLTFLDRTHQSARGLLEFFEYLQTELALSGIREDPYLRTHPLTIERINNVRDHVLHSPYSDVPDPPQWVEDFKMIKAKLAAFSDPPAQVLNRLKSDDNSVPTRYARAIAYYRIPQLKQALEVIDGLLREHPDNPYFQELKGQMLFENGRVAEAVPYYEQAVRLRPDIALLRVEAAHVELETDNPALVPKALSSLKEAVRFEDRDCEARHFLAIAQGRSGALAMMALELAEEASCQGNSREAGQQAERALREGLPAGPDRFRAQDILREARSNPDNPPSRR